MKLDPSTGPPVDPLSSGSRVSVTIQKSSFKHETAVTVLMSFVFFLAVGGYWMMRTLKSGVFVAMVGLQYEPHAKLGTVFVLIPLLIGYNSVVVRYAGSMRMLAFTVLGIYCALFALLGVLISLPELGMENRIASRGRLLGWITYWTIESFASISIPMIWSIVSTLIPKSSASAAYTIFTVFAQIGAISGATMAMYTQQLSFHGLFALQVVILAVLIVLIHTVYVLTYGSRPVVDEHIAHPPETGLLEGLRLIGANPYVFGILIVSVTAEVVTTVMDYQMKVLAKAEYKNAEEFSAFLGSLGQIVNGVSLIFALVGTRFVIRWLGLRMVLITFPLSILALIVSAYLYPSLQFFFYGLVAIKALGYSLNSPAKEILYIQTSNDVKIKAKSWIDMFGTRAAKGLGSTITSIFSQSPEMLLTVGSLFSGAVVSFWLVIAARTGRAYKQQTVHELTHA